jgi:ABC-2 type transport system ATP-binding protein
MCGVLNQTEGNVYIHGRDIREEPELAKREIGFLPQQPPLYPDLSIDEYLTYCAELRMIPKNKVKGAVKDVKERCGIGHFSSRLIRNLSGGYKQRVGIAQAIIHQPKLVVMDEPTNGLDPNQLIEVRKLIKEIALDHVVLISSHILSEIHLMCKDVVMIEGGRIVFSDSMNAFNDYIQPHSLVIRMERPPATTELLMIKGVTKAEFMTDRQARVYFDGDEEVAERLIAASIQHDWKLRELTLDKGLLDDIFKQLSIQPHS